MVSKINLNVFYCFAYMHSKWENIEIATAQRLLLARTFYDVSGQVFDDKVDEKLRRNISILLQDYDDIRPQYGITPQLECYDGIVESNPMYRKARM